MAIGGPTVTLIFKGETSLLRKEISHVVEMIAGAGAAVGALAAIGAAASVAVAGIALIPLTFLGIGIAAAWEAERVRTAWHSLWDDIKTQSMNMATPIQDSLITVADMLRAAFARLAPTLAAVFRYVAPFLIILTQGVIDFVENAMPGFLYALSRSEPIIRALARGLGTLGAGLGGFFGMLAEGTPGAVVGLDALFDFTADLLVWLGAFAGRLANVLGPAFAALYPYIERIIGALGDSLLIIFQDIVPSVIAFAAALADTLSPTITALAPMIAVLINTILHGLVPLLYALAPQIVDVARALLAFLVPAIEANDAALLALVTKGGRCSSPSSTPCPVTSRRPRAYSTILR
jgi:hypothetical protein